MSHTKPLPSLVDLESLCVDHTRWHRRGAGANHAVRSVGTQHVWVDHVPWLDDVCGAVSECFKGVHFDRVSVYVQLKI